MAVLFASVDKKNCFKLQDYSKINLGKMDDYFFIVAFKENEATTYLKYLKSVRKIHVELSFNLV